METWRYGRRHHQEIVRNESLPLDLFLERADKTPMRVAGTAVFLNARTDVVPASLLHNLKHNKVLHERVILAHVTVDDTPFVREGQAHRGQQARQGLLQREHASRLLRDAGCAARAGRMRAPFGLAVDVDHTTFFVGHETLVPSQHPALGRWRTWLYMRLAANALSPARFYCLPPNRVVELGTQITI